MNRFYIVYGNRARPSPSAQQDLHSGAAERGLRMADDRVFSRAVWGRRALLGAGAGLVGAGAIGRAAVAGPSCSASSGRAGYRR